MKENGYSVRAIRSDGSIFYYENDDFMMIKLEGVDFPQLEVFKEPQGLGNGDIITGKRKCSRQIELSTVPRHYNDGNYGTLRSRAIFFHNPSYTYDLEVTYMGNTKVAKDCEITTLSIPTERYKKNATLTVSFLSPHSELFAKNTDKTNLSSITPRWVVKRSYLNGKKLLYATEDKTDSIIVNYIGSIDTKPVITITANGYIRNLSITIGTVTESINVEAHSGDIIVVDGSKSFATKNGEMIPITTGADYRRLVIHPGDNMITVKAQNGDAFKTDISYIGRYDGI